MKYLVLGGSGLLGNEIVRSLVGENEVTFTYLNNLLPVRDAKPYQLDLTDAAAIGRLIEGISPDIVIHTVAPPSVDWHEREHAAAYLTNVIGTKAVAEKSHALGAKLIYISTAFVFPDIAKAFTEEDIPAPINFYGAAKLGAEQAAHTNPDHLIIRTDQIYGWSRPGQKKSFVVGTLEKLENGQKVEVCRDWLNSPTYVKDLSSVILALAEKDRHGIYHAVGGSFLDRVSWAVKIAEAFGKDSSLVAGIDSAILKLPARRPNARISNDKIQRETGIRMKSVEDGLEAMKGDRE